MKTIGAILLVAGTCIGSGMIALPMVLAKLGIIPSIVLMITIWFIMYYTSLINLELNLQAGEGIPLGALGRLFSGRTSEWIGKASLKLLSYSLLAAFIYGASSIIQQLAHSKMGLEYSFGTIATLFSAACWAILLLPIKYIDYANRVLFMGLLAVAGMLIIGLAVSVNWTNLPLFPTENVGASALIALIPVVFTSFGFQVIFHTLTNYCHKNPKMLKAAFLWGSLIPASVYILWTCSILSAVYHENPAFYGQMAYGTAEVGELIQVLSDIAKWQSVQIMVWSISLLAILTSVMGVGIGLVDSLNGNRKIVASAITIGPAYLVVICIPNAFISVLGFAGMILAVIAILLPAYLLWKLRPSTLNYEELKAKWLTRTSVVIGIGVIFSELWTSLNAM